MGGIILTLTSDFNEAGLVSGRAFVGKLMAGNASSGNYLSLGLPGNLALAWDGFSLMGGAI